MALVVAAFGAVVAPAAAAPFCDRVPDSKALVSGRGTLESVIVDRAGDLYFTDVMAGQLLRLRHPGAEPEVVASGIQSPGGLALGPGGSILVGFGSSIATGATGNLIPEAGILRIDPETGSRQVYAKGLTQANGLARGPDDAIYASNSAGLGIDRVLRGQVKRRWSPVLSSNGLVVSADGRYLYAAQTFLPAAIARVEIANPTNVTTEYRAPLLELAAGLDGITRDGRDRIYAAANGSGEVLKIDESRNACALARYQSFPRGPSAVAFGRGDHGFDSHNLYATTQGGVLVELRNVRR